MLLQMSDSREGDNDMELPRTNAQKAIGARHFLFPRTKSVETRVPGRPYPALSSKPQRGTADVPGRDCGRT